MRIHIYMMCYPISLSFFSVDNLYSHHWNTQFCSFLLGPIYLVFILKNSKDIPVVNQLHSLSCPYQSRRRQKKCWFNLNVILPTTHIPTTSTCKWPYKMMPGLTIMVLCKQRRNGKLSVQFNIEYILTSNQVGYVSTIWYLFLMKAL